MYFNESFRKAKGIDLGLSMANISKEVEHVLGSEILLSKDVVGPDAKSKSKNLKQSEILLENLRFHKKKWKAMWRSQNNFQN